MGGHQGGHKKMQLNGPPRKWAKPMAYQKMYTAHGVEICKAWIVQNLEPAKEVNSLSSYVFKHTVQRDTGKYVSQDDFVMAMEILGYTPIPIERSPSHLFKTRMRRWKRIYGRAKANCP